MANQVVNNVKLTIADQSVTIVLPNLSNAQLLALLSRYALAMGAPVEEMTPAEVARFVVRQWLRDTQDVARQRQRLELKAARAASDAVLLDSDNRLIDED